MQQKLHRVSSTIGESRHICGDATLSESYHEIMQEDKATFLLADPPYCLLTRRNKKTGQKRDSKKAKINHDAVTRYENVKQYRHFTKAWLSQAVKHLSDNAHLCIWTNFLGIKPIKEVLESLGTFYFLGEFRWCKLTKETNSGSEIIGRFYEVGLIFSKKQVPPLLQSDNAQVWSVVSHYDEEKEGDLWGKHPNHKTYSVLEPLIRSYSKPGDRVLDPFSGSGSTPAAAIKLGRLVSAMELRSEWADISQKRISHI